MVLGILWVGGLGAILALIFGYVSKRRIDESGGRQTGRGMAIAGIVLGWVGVAGLILTIVIVASLNHSANNLATEYLTTTTELGNTGGFTTTSTTGTTDNIESPAGGTVNTWTASATASGGYSETISILTGHVEHAKDGATNGPDVAGQACSFNSTTDALVPVVINLTNTTSDFSSTVGYDIGFVGSDASAISFEGSYTGGEQCDGASSDEESSSINGNSVGLSAQHTSTTDGFLILPNYYSPAHPNGTTALLADIVLSISADQEINTSDSDSSTDYTVNSVTGPGVESSDGSWSFDLAGTTPSSGNSGNTGSGNSG
jgi:hypothetical protein